MPQIRLGNAAPVQVTRGENDEIIRTALEGLRTTTIGSPDDTLPDGTVVPLEDLDTVFTTITHGNGVWAWHSDADPTWVECEWAELANRIAGYYGIPIGVQPGYPGYPDDEED